MSEEEFIEKYGKVMVKFSSYYKFEFTFKGYIRCWNSTLKRYAKNNLDILVRVSGADNTYRLSVEPNIHYAVELLGITYGAVKDGEQTIDEYTDY